jgi:glycosyltransferase involved in cell wall biosynthesis
VITQTLHDDACHTADTRTSGSPDESGNASSPLVSVIIPAYNCERDLEQTVQSARSQSGCRVEIIIVDDSSTDSTAEVIRSFGDTVKTLRVPNGGPGIARNVGAALATGEWLAFLDADDLWEPDKLQKQLLLAEQEKTAVVYSNTRNFGATSDVDEIRFAEDQLPSGEVFESLLDDNFVTFSSVVIRRDAFFDVGGFNPRRHAGEDWDLLLRLAEKHRFSVVKEPVTKYRWSEGSFSKRHRFFLKHKLAVVHQAFTTPLGRQLSFMRRHRIVANVWGDSAWFAAPTARWTAIGWYVRSWLSWPLALWPVKGIAKALIGRR